MSIGHHFVREWRDTHQHRTVGPETANKLFNYLDAFPWGSSRLQWEEIPNAVIPFGDGDPQPAWVARFSDTPLGRHAFIMVAYAPNQEALIGKSDEVLADIDTLYAGSPGARYFCGADIIEDVLTLTVEDFGEFSDEGVRVHAPGHKLCT